MFAESASAYSNPAGGTALNCINSQIRGWRAFSVRFAAAGRSGAGTQQDCGLPGHGVSESCTTSRGISVPPGAARRTAGGNSSPTWGLLSAPCPADSLDGKHHGQQNEGQHVPPPLVCEVRAKSIRPECRTQCHRPGHTGTLLRWLGAPREQKQRQCEHGESNNNMKEQVHLINRLWQVTLTAFRTGMFRVQQLL